MTDTAKLPKPAIETTAFSRDSSTQPYYTEAQLKQYGDDRAREALIEASRKQEPVAYEWCPPKKPELARLEYQKEPKKQLSALGFVSKPLFVAPVVAPDVLKDAERYRWLRDTNGTKDHPMRSSGHLDPLQVERIYCGRPEEQWYMHDFAFAPDGNDFDAAIDAAMGGAND